MDGVYQVNIRAVPKTWKNEKAWHEQRTIELLMLYSLRWVSCVWLKGIRLERWVDAISRRPFCIIIKY